MATQVQGQDDLRPLLTPQTSRPMWKAILNVLAAAAFVFPFFYFGYQLADEGNPLPSFAVTSSVLISGLAVGWLIGIFLSPDKHQEQRFASYARAVAAGVSGYALAKLDPIVTEMVKPETVMNALNGVRFLGFVVNLIVGTIIAFVWREYA